MTLESKCLKHMVNTWGQGIGNPLEGIEGMIRFPQAVFRNSRKSFPRIYKLQYIINRQYKANYIMFGYIYTE